MTKEQLMKNYELTNDEMKNDFIEWITICKYMDEQDFNNMFRLHELNEADFFRIIDFLWKQECFNILFMLMARYIKRFNHENWNYYEEIDDKTDQRISKLNEFKDFKVPPLM